VTRSGEDAHGVVEALHFSRAIPPALGPVTKLPEVVCAPAVHLAVRSPCARVPSAHGELDRAVEVNDAGRPADAIVLPTATRVADLMGVVRTPAVDVTLRDDTRVKPTRAK
jgi:hypothetical protein